MAILDAYPGLEVTILVDEEPLPECENEEEPPTGNEITKYIEAQSEKDFKIRIKFGKGIQRNHGIQTKLSLDDMNPLKGFTPEEHESDSRVFQGCTYTRHGTSTYRSLSSGN